MKKKLLTIMLSIFMVLASFPATIFAEGDLTVTYDANGATSGTVPVDSNKYEDGAPVTVLGNTGNLQKDGYVFNGWNTQTDGKGIHRQPGGDPFNINADVTLYAEWASKHDVTVNVTPSGAGTASADPTSAGEGSHVSLNASPNPGYRFKEWQTTSGTLDDIHNDLTMPNEDVTVTAVFVPIIEIQVTNNDGANGTVQVKFGDGEFQSCTANSTKLDIPEGATTVTFKAVPDGTFTLQDCTILVNNSDYDESKSYKASVEGDGYTYTLPNDGSQVVFKASFGEKLLEWNTISWGGGNVIQEHGKVIPDVIHVGEKSYNAPFSSLTSQDSLKNNHVTYSNGDLFVAKGTTDDISIDFHFIPDYGYQVTDVKVNESDSLLESFEPGDDNNISAFTFEYKPNSNVHFIVEFTDEKDIIAKNSNIVDDASISNGENAINSGNLKLEIEDNINPNEGLIEYIGEEAENAKYLDMELSQVVSKTGDNGNWEKPLSELNDDISVTLNIPSLEQNSDYYLVREHENSDGSYEYDVIENAIFNKDEKTVTFETDKFSTYALVENKLEDGEFTIEYDDVFFDDKYHASIEVNGDVIHNAGVHKFKANDQLTFTLEAPEEKKYSEHIVEIQVFDGHDDVFDTVYRSDFEEGNPNKIDIIDNKFTFTPTSDTSFIVRVWWSDYDFFGPNKGQYMIEINKDGAGTVDVDPYTEYESYFGMHHEKHCYLVNQKATISFEANIDNEDLLMLVIDGSDGHREYTQNSIEYPLSYLWNSADECYKLDITGESEGDCFYISAQFGPKELGDNEFRVECLTDDIYGGSVKLNDDEIFNGGIHEFTSNEKLTFTLIPPEGDSAREELEHIVEIEILDGDEETPNTIYRSDFGDENPNKISIIDNTKFDFTPTSDVPFIIKVWWSHYDAFGPIEGQFLIETNVCGDGEIVFSPSSEASSYFIESDGSESSKNCFSTDNDVTLKFVAGETGKLDFLVYDNVYDSIVYSSSPDPELGWRDISEVWDEKEGCYKITIKNASENDSYWLFCNFGGTKPAKTIADILPENFPTTYGDGWINRTVNNNRIYINDELNDALLVSNGEDYEKSLDLDTPLTRTEDGYSAYQSEFGTYIFHMNNDALISIEYYSDDENKSLDGVYEQLTIADILGTVGDFPTSYTTSDWKDDNDARAYIKNDSKLTFTIVKSTNPWQENDISIDINHIVVKNGNDYTFKMIEEDLSEDVITFTMSEGSLDSIATSGNYFSLLDLDGIYAPGAARYNITYLDKGGSAFSGTHEEGYPTNHTFGFETALKGATKENYVFDGWYTDIYCTDGNKVTVLGAEDYTADITLYAKFIEAEAAVVNTFDGTTNYYVSLLDALDDAESMDSVVLLRDINFTNIKDIYIDEFVFLDLNNHRLHTNGTVTNNGGIVLYNENADIIDYLLYNVPGAYGAGEELQLPNDSNPDYVVPDGTFLTVDVGTSPNCQEFEIVVFDGEFIWNADVKKGTYLSIRDLTLGGDIIAPTDSNDKDTLVEVTELKLNDDIVIGSNNEDDGNATLFIESYDSSSDGKHNRGTINPNGKTITLNKTGVLVVSNDVSFDESIIKPGVDGMAVDKVYDEANKTYEYTLKLDHHYTNDPFTIPYNYAGTIEFVTDADCSVVGDVTVKVDGKVLNDSKYDLSFASVHITLHNDYLRSLSAGKHTTTISVKGYKTISQDFYITGVTPRPRYVVPNTGVN